MMVSVIIPVFNRQNTIKDAVYSVLKQSYDNLECIVVDDCSTDMTYKRIMEISDNRLRYYKVDKNRGACYARNYGISKARGEYIAFNDSDDIWHKDKLKKQLAFMTENNCDVSFCCYKSMGMRGMRVFPNWIKNQKDVTLTNLLKRNFASTQTIISKKSCLENFKFDEHLSRYQDWDIMIRLMDSYVVGFQHETLVDVYWGNDNISADSVKGYEACEYILEKYNKLYTLNSAAQSNVLTYMGTYKYQLGEKEEAEDLFMQALKIYPKNYIAFFKFVLSKTGLLMFRYDYFKWKEMHQR